MIHHAITIHLQPEQQQQILIIAGFATFLILVAVVTLVTFAVQVSALERDNAELRHRLQTAEGIGQTQDLALRTVDAMARASRGSR